MADPDHTGATGPDILPAPTADASEGPRSVIVHDPTTVQQRENRIEALRAASRIVGGASFGGKITINDGEKGTDRFTTALAEYFVRYIEKGER